ncbi:IS630 family transposase [Magnetovirga frankeli]|uniref:IS630 family transposase n=1 Tax=Magnetovirga frankeli TaxID=947516 RepID=UPI0012938CFE|nr:IS630 family transposase [gamma proteobacterium SS-5]QFY89053.1 IS630 family transposase [gamma proteobacterium SS-5]QFY90026.1 IS630 family transposase [gamma proteobacterium SS-5]QFY90457.1 IS630 family transposase [gamma proteobacterium SS-5]
MSTQIEIREQRRREVVEAIVLRQEPVHLVQRIYNVPERSVFNWLSLYRSGGWDALREGARSGRPRKLSTEDMRWVYYAVTLGNPQQYQFDFCLWTLNALRTLIEKERKVKLSKSAVSRLLRHLGLSPQRPIYKSYQQDPRKIDRYLKETFPEAVAQAQRLGAAIFFVDEAAVRSDAHRGLTWGKIGQTPVVKNSGGRFGLKVISAVSPRGDMRFSFIEDKMNSTKFIAFLKKLHRDAGQPILVITDNARYHHSKETQRFIAEQEGKILLAFLPAYSPELNPDEQVWNHAKRRLSQLSIFNLRDMKRHLTSILRSIQKQGSLIRSFFRMDSTRYILEALG